MTRAVRLPLAVMAAMLIAAMWFASAAQAQTTCGTRDAIVKKLDEIYGEVRRGGGLAGPTAIYEIWASEATGTWTILKTTPNGLTCILAVGTAWHDDTGELTPTAGGPV